MKASGAEKVRHSSVKGDPKNDWPEPGAVEFGWEGEDEEGRVVKARMATELVERADRVDVMGELPKFVKQIVAGASGTKPYIYQVSGGVISCLLMSPGRRRERR